MSESVFSSLTEGASGCKVPEKGWVTVRRDGKLLFEYHPELELVRVVRRKRPFVVDLKGVQIATGTPVS